MKLYYFCTFKALQDDQGKIKMHYWMSRVKTQLSGQKSIGITSEDLITVQQTSWFKGSHKTYFLVLKSTNHYKPQSTDLNQVQKPTLAVNTKQGSDSTQSGEQHHQQRQQYYTFNIIRKIINVQQEKRRTMNEVQKTTSITGRVACFYRKDH